MFIDQFRITQNHRADSYTIHVLCQFCLSSCPVTVHAPDLFKYRQGAFVQEAFPYLTPEERELLITAICSECWDEAFLPEEED